MTTDNAPRDSVNVLINSISSQFEAVAGGETIGILAYARSGRHFDLRYTFVLPSRRSRGVAGALLAAALDAIRSADGTVTPSCGFVSAFIRAHAEYEDLILYASPSRSGALPVRVRHPCRSFVGGPWGDLRVEPRRSGEADRGIAGGE
ncbi:N-acetyltransferase [Kribbella sp. NPDC026596]|uniref:GNAT family N-acetyltransferase n=1 Tax=Kribbella sp. NPDC026596 TaxID=3155122 RepID=UPI0033FC48DE